MWSIFAKVVLHCRMFASIAIDIRDWWSIISLFNEISRSVSTARFRNNLYYVCVGYFRNVSILRCSDFLCIRVYWFFHVWRIHLNHLLTLCLRRFFHRFVHVYVPVYVDDIFNFVLICCRNAKGHVWSGSGSCCLWRGSSYKESPIEYSQCPAQDSYQVNQYISLCDYIWCLLPHSLRRECCLASIQFFCIYWAICCCEKFYQWWFRHTLDSELNRN